MAGNLRESSLEQQLLLASERTKSLKNKHAIGFKMSSKSFEIRIGGNDIRGSYYLYHIILLFIIRLANLLLVCKDL